MPDQPKKRRWHKRTLLVVSILLVSGILLGSIAPEARLRDRPRSAIATNWSDDIGSAAAKIDGEIDQKIDSTDLRTAARADWYTVCRRLSLALVGNGMSLQEIRALESVPEAERVAFWTNYLLDDSRWSVYFGERLARAYVGTHDGQFLVYRRRRFRLWLADQLAKEVPYDQLVRTMIASEGRWTDKPEVNFITATLDGGGDNRADPIRLAGKTSRAFLGMRIDCLQCHDDFVGATSMIGQDNQLRLGTQLDFHQLAAFYGGTRVAPAIVTGIHDDKRPYETTLLGHSDPSEIKPSVPFFPEGDPQVGGLRQRLAGWVTHPENKAFARATVNRIWALMFGRPLHAPVDNIPINGPFPAGLEALANDFQATGYDVKRLIRLIAATEVFQRDSRLQEQDVTPEHESLWATFPIIQLRPEQVAASLTQACRLRLIDEESSIIAQLEMFGTVNDFLKGYGDRGEDEFNSQSVTIPQRLLMMNSNLVRGRIDNNPIMNASTHIAMLAKDDSKAIDSAFLSVLNRVPSFEEKEAFEQVLTESPKNKRSQVLTVIFWTLLNSTEFAWNH